MVGVGEAFSTWKIFFKQERAHLSKSVAFGDGRRK
jgi:hypothetical protein